MKVWCRVCKKKVIAKQKKGLFGNGVMVCGECGERERIKFAEE